MATDMTLAPRAVDPICKSVYWPARNLVFGFTLLPRFPALGQRLK
jgi:hypothetical protein